MSGDEGTWMHRLAAELQPFPRSLTGDGLRATLGRLAEEIPLETVEVPSGTPVLDWEIPPEWNLREAWIEGPDGRRVVDAADSPLHVVGYSIPVRERMSLAELRPHLHSVPGQPDRVPYRTTYFRRGWGFCLAESTAETLPDGQYEVCVDAVHEPGSLTYGECRIGDPTDRELLVSTHVCHPVMANDNLSGIVVATALARRLRERDLPFAVRFLFVPATLGPIAWMARNPGAVGRVHAGMVLACAGDRGRTTWKRSRRGNSEVDRAAALVFRDAGNEDRVRDFVPYGYDERQYCSPGFDLPIGRLTRTPNGEFPEYHTSADDLSFIDPEALLDTLDTADAILSIVQEDATFVNLEPYGEPQLGRRGIYEGLAGRDRLPAADFALLWVLNQSDGSASLVDIAARSGLPFPAIRRAADRLLEAGLLAPSPLHPTVG